MKTKKLQMVIQARIALTEDEYHQLKVLAAQERVPVAELLAEGARKILKEKRRKT